MAIVVLGNGRCGTNILLEILTGSPELSPSSSPEDKSFFARRTTYDKDYLTKCDTHYFDISDMLSTLTLNPDLKILWMIRDPRDMCLSKIYRGQPGNDCDTLADDATPSGCLEDMDHMYSIYSAICNDVRVKLVKMEDILIDVEGTTREICEWLGIDYHPEMKYFYKRMRNPKKAERYKRIDLSQLQLWKRWSSIYDGWFSDKAEMVSSLFYSVDHLVTRFGYSHE